MECIDIDKTGIRADVVREIRALARQYDIDQVILFGSRSRGDYRKTSDIDLAVSGGNFTRFALDVEEDTSTLLMFDFVDLNRSVQNELLESIYREGKMLYEKI